MDNIYMFDRVKNLFSHGVNKINIFAAPKSSFDIEIMRK